MSLNKVTPMMQQYLSIKDKYKEPILMYRMGDFFEMFFEDAEIASPILEITLTSRNKKDKKPVPMCGVPAKAVKGYIAKLINKGLKVAICDQVEDPAFAKGIVKREVTQVITPGMIVDNAFLDEKSNNYILAISHINGKSSGMSLGLSFLDISTGTFRVAESKDLNSLIEESLRISPNEILFSELSKNDPIVTKIARRLPEKSITYIDEKAFDFVSSRQRLINQFNTFSLEGFGCENLKSGISAAGALLYYVSNTQKQDISHLGSIETYFLDNYLVVDDTSCNNLELMKNLRTGSTKGTLLGIIDKTITAMGSRLLNDWLRYPLLDPAKIEKRLDAVQEAKTDSQTRNDLRLDLKSISDLERLGSKISMGHANARDLISLKTSLQKIPGLISRLENFNSEFFRFNKDQEQLNNLASLLEYSIREDAAPTIHEGNIIKKGYNPELDELISFTADSRQWLARLEVSERKSTGINSLKVKYNKVFGYYIEVSKLHMNSVPSHYIRKQTLVNAERYITEELKIFETKILNAQEKRNSLEYELFNKVRLEIIENIKIILDTAGFIANLDCLLNLAFIADHNDYVRPSLNSDDIINIEDGRHPVIEKLITGERFVPNNIVLDNTENQILIITGPNMAGKSTVLRQVALLVIMTQMGSFIPAKYGNIGITDRIFTRVGALDNLSHGQSTFMVEMQETANILHNATASSLIIMDEIGRGTSTFDGLSIAWAVAEYLHDLRDTGVKTLFATHYHELTDLEFTKNRVKNLNIAVKEFNEDIIFLRKLVPGGTNKSYGIQVARLAGLPFRVIERAKKILKKIESGEQVLDEENQKAKKKSTKNSGHTQLDLFPKPENEIITQLKNTEISILSPIEAMNILNELCEKVKDTIKTDK